MTPLPFTLHLARNAEGCCWCSEGAGFIKHQKTEHCEADTEQSVHGKDHRDKARQKQHGEARCKFYDFISLPISPTLLDFWILMHVQHWFHALGWRVSCPVGNRSSGSVIVLSPCCWSDLCTVILGHCWCHVLPLHISTRFASRVKPAILVHTGMRSIRRITNLMVFFDKNC
jgi:hypothetical protein